jgi:hypothetical protein
MRYIHSIFGIFLVVIIIEYIRYIVQKKTINKIETINKENYSNETKKKFRATESTTEYNKMVLSNSNGDLSSIGCPKGVIWLWSGSIDTIPDGWALCNGENGTPDLRGRFVLGVNPNAKANTNFMINELNAKGGNEKALLKHKHTIGGGKSSYYVGGGGDWKVGGGNFYVNLNGDQMDEAGNVTDNTLPPYYSLSYIMKIV